MKASAIARLLDAELEGGADPEISGAAPLDRAGPGDLALVSRARYASTAAASEAGLLLVARALADRVEADRPRIVVSDTYAALIEVLPRLYPEPTAKPGIHPTAIVDPDAELGVDVEIGPYAVVAAATRVGARARIGAHVAIGEGCELGDDVRLHPHVVLYPRTRVGPRSIIHAGARLGSDGFGYAAVDGVAWKVPQVGGCQIGADVEIGANTTVDRGSMGNTEIGDHVKIDNLVHIGHNVRIGAGSTIVAQVGISGSTRIGRGVTIAGQAGLNGHIEIGDGVTIGAQAGVFGDVPPGETWSGYPARPHRDALRIQAHVFRLPELVARLQALESDRPNGEGGE